MNTSHAMRWDCDKDGCFNKLKRLKFEVFYDCFTGKINFSDVDAIVEINGQVLMMECKEPGLSLPVGQRIMYERMTSNGNVTVFVVQGAPETMIVKRYCHFWMGVPSKPRVATLDDLNIRIGRWVQFARGFK